jgi:serine/threonine protein kinase
MNGPQQVAEAHPARDATGRPGRDGGAVPDAAAPLAPRLGLPADKSAVLDLAYEEFCQQTEAGQAPDPESFCARFPAYRSSLRRLLAAHQFLAANSEVLRAAPPVRWPEPGERWGDWTLVRELGRGAFARVYLATEASTGDRSVAVKLSFEGGAEARTLGRISHPNVVPVLSARSDPASGLTAVCMPFLGGATLTDVLDRAFRAAGDAPPRGASLFVEAARAAVRPGEPVPDAPPPDGRLARGSYEEGVALAGLGLAEALAFLHAREVYHLDLKPSNVLLGTDGRPLLLDFNLSADGRNATPRLGGTLPYMAPEQLEALAAGATDSRSLDGRADLYSLGVILYELLTSELPFGPVPALPTRELAPLLLGRQRAGCRPVRAAAPRAARPLAAVVQRCLAFDRAERPATAGDVALALRRFLDGVERKRFLRRLAWLVPVAAAAALLVVLLTPAPPAERARAAFREGDYPRAEQLFGQAVTDNPRDADSLWLRALARLKRNEPVPFETARPHLVLAMEELQAAYPLQSDPRTQAYIGYCLSRLSAYPDALLAFDAAESGGYRTAILYNNRAYIHCMRNQLEAASKDLVEAIRLNEKLAPAYYNRASLAYQRWMQDGNTAAVTAGRDDATKAIELGLRSPEFFCFAARLSLACGEKKDALDLLGSAVEWGKKPAQLAADKELNRALPGLRTVLSRQPNGMPCPAVPQLALPVKDLDE